MSCFVLNSGFYFHLSFVVHLPVLRVLLLHRLGRQQEKKNKTSFSHTQLTKRNMPCKTEAQFQAATCVFPQARKQQAEERNNLQSTERILQSLSLTKVMEEHSRLGLKFKEMFSYTHPLNRTVENMHKHTLCKLFMLLAEIICTLERGKRYLYLHEHNYWINPPSLAKIKDSLSLSPHSLDPEEISIRKRKTTCMFETTEDKIRRWTSL